MTDADVDGAHIASLLMTFFYREMPKMIENGHLFLAQPPLFRISRGGKTEYARDEKHKDELIRDVFGGAKVEITRFKGLGEMQSVHLRETTMDVEQAHAAQGRRAPCARHRGATPGDGYENPCREPDGPQAGEALRLHPGACEVRPRSRRLRQN